MWSMPSDPRERQITALVAVICCVAIYKFIFEWLPQIQIYLYNKSEQRQVLNALSEKNKDIVSIDDEDSITFTRVEQMKKTRKAEHTMPNYSLRASFTCDDKLFDETTPFTKERKSRIFNLPNYSLTADSEQTSSPCTEAESATSDSRNMPNYSLPSSAAQATCEEESVSAKPLATSETVQKRQSSSTKGGRKRSSLSSEAAANIDYSRPFRLNDNIAQLLEQTSASRNLLGGNTSSPERTTVASSSSSANNSHNPWQIYDGDDQGTQAIVAAMAAEEAARERELRRQQDAEYQASLQRDRETAERMDLEEKQHAARAEKLRLLRESVGTEPIDEEGNTLLVSFRVRTMLGDAATVTSSRINRRFLRNSTIGHVLDFVELQQFEFGTMNSDRTHISASSTTTFELLLSHPKRVFSRTTPQELTLTEAGLDTDSLVWIEFHSD